MKILIVVGKERKTYESECVGTGERTGGRERPCRRLHFNPIICLDRYSGQIRPGIRPPVFSAPPVFADEKMAAVRVDQTVAVFHRRPRGRIAGGHGSLRRRDNGECHVTACFREL